jgi:hypothetical protein
MTVKTHTALEVQVVILHFAECDDQFSVCSCDSLYDERILVE